MNRTKRKSARLKNPFVDANLFSRWSFWWLRDLFRQGLKRPLTIDDIYEEPQTLDSNSITQKFEQIWENEQKSKDPSVVRLILRCYGAKFISLQILYSVTEMTAGLLKPLFLGELVAYFATAETATTKQEAFFCACAIVLCSLVPVLSYNPFFFYISQLGTKIRVGLGGLIYRKSLQISMCQSHDGLRAKAINVLSTDLQRITDVQWCLDDIIKAPLLCVIIGYILYRELGFAAIVGLAFLLSFTPFELWAAKKITHHSEQAAEFTDLRVKLMNEIIQGIEVIKMYTWERYFAKIIANVRRKEVQALRKNTYINAMLRCTGMLGPLSVFLALMSFVLSGDVLSAKRVYLVTSYFAIITEFMGDNWSSTLVTFAESYTSAKRCTEFLLAGKDTQKFKNKKREFDPQAEKKKVLLQNVTASWESEAECASVAQLELDIKDDTLVAVVGPVGAGKSTLLNVLLGEVDISEGEVLVHGKVSYASQEAWVFEGTVRDNVVFVEDYNAQRYKRVLKVCALEKDLQLMPHGDLTIVGERGVRLSGGQKARVNLARAIYREADIYLLDDPLSAVDTHVGKHIFEQCIKKFLSGKIRILVTHQVQYLFDAQPLFVMRAGRITAQGSYQDLQKSREFKFLRQTRQESGSDRVSVSRHYSRSDSELSDDTSILLKLDNELAEDTHEEQMEGSVKFCVYKFYFQVLKNPLTVLLLLGLFFLARFMLASVDLLLSRWVTWEEQLALEQGNNATTVAIERVQQQRRDLMVHYTSTLALAVIVDVARTFGFFAMSLHIALKLHDQLFDKVTRATMYFFNTNTSGKILNRFAKDVSMIDSSLPYTIISCIIFLIDVCSVFTVVSAANYWLLLPCLLIVFVMVLLQHLYVSTSRSVQRIESTTRSPLYTLTNQTFQGLATIRALEAESALQDEFRTYQNANTSAWFLSRSASSAFSLWVDVLCVLYMAMVTFSFLAFDDASFRSSQVGLAIIHSMSMIGLCQWGLRQLAYLENEMTSVERIKAYTQLPSEPALETAEEHKPAIDWPSEGRVEFEQLTFRYSPKDEPVLRGLTFSIAPKEKIGIVGRTGAGKSSIIQSLFRLAYNEGCIRIDGVDIANLGLYDLRNKISIIPQDPILFSGTLRYNLDPTEERSSEEIWKALADVELSAYVSTLVDSLNYHLLDGGSNFSVGQRQLVCLARAILRNNKILILDEATANVDPETDKLIQTTIREKFADCTVLTIAHRLHTIMDSDRVLVMDSGHMVELDHPHELLQRKGGYFYQLVRQTGSTTAATLRAMAQQSFSKRILKN